MNPLEYARTDLLPAVRDGLEDAALTVPERQWSQVGINVIVDCEALIVSAGDVTPIEIMPGGNCGYLDQATYLMIVAYDCNVVFDEQGLTIPEKMEEASHTLELAGMVLNTVAHDVVGEAILHPNPWQIGYSWDGGLGIVSMQIVLAVP